jgi:hypothetical protein
MLYSNLGYSASDHLNLLLDFACILPRNLFAVKH